MSCQKKIELNERGSGEDLIIIPDVYIEKGDPFLGLDTLGVLLYHKQPFSGYLLSENEIEGVKSKVPFFKGLKEGIVLGVYQDSSLCFKREYHSGEKEGVHEGWYASGQLKFRYCFKGGLSVGNHKEWYRDGVLYKDLNYVAGNQLGGQREWFDNGKLKANYVIRENGRKYGLTGVKRCNNINLNKEVLEPAKKE